MESQTRLHKFGYERREYGLVLVQILEYDDGVDVVTLG